MKVYAVRTDIEKFQVILPVPEMDDELFDTLNFNGQPKKDVWSPIEYYIDNPLKKQGDFFSFIGSGSFACNKRAIEKLYWFWNSCSELLPIFLEDGTELFIINVTDCINALDHKATEYYFYDDGTRSNRIKKYQFHRKRFHESSIFKIPETANTQILTHTGVKSTKDEFYFAYVLSGLEGLIFEEIYTDESAENNG